MTLLAQASNEIVTITARLTQTAVIVGIGILLYSVARIGGGRYVQRMQGKEDEAGERAQTLWSVLRRVVLLLILILVVLFGLLAWGVSITPLLGLGTVFAAAIGFGAQDLVKDFLAGFFILLEDQFHVGDVVTIAGTSGVVEDIQLRVTLLRDLEGNQHFVPNGQITVSSNFTSKFAQPVIDVGVAYETDIDHALEVFGDELKRLASDPEFELLITEPPEILGVNELADSSVVLRGRLTTRADDRWSVRREALKRVKKRFDREGISIPFPQITLNQKNQ
ncbi:MAG TPA: mechanosensitive ion channel family protein [Acidimicrobiia bacterium]|nr:mechanosensitive ion channel family protein [Acidimicrobiia bacterium]